MKTQLMKYRYPLLGILVVLTVLTFAFFRDGNTESPKRAPDPVNAEETAAPQAIAAGGSATEAASPSAAPSEAPSAAATDSPEASSSPAAVTDPPAMAIDPKTGQDRYHTDPVPPGVPAPVEPQETTGTAKESVCTLSIRCDTALRQTASLPPEKAAILPPDGVILPPTQVVFHEGESVFHLLLRETKRNKIHMEYVNTPIYNSAYIEGIANLYEFDCGELSGWMYKVNGLFPNYGCSRYSLQSGDTVEWVYTCDLGRDVGDTYGTRNGRQ